MEGALPNTHWPGANLRRGLVFFLQSSLNQLIDKKIKKGKIKICSQTEDRVIALFNFITMHEKIELHVKKYFYL